MTFTGRLPAPHTSRCACEGLRLPALIAEAVTRSQPAEIRSHLSERGLGSHIAPSTLGGTGPIFTRLVQADGDPRFLKLGDRAQDLPNHQGGWGFVQEVVRSINGYKLDPFGLKPGATVELKARWWPRVPRRLSPKELADCRRRNALTGGSSAEVPGTGGAREGS